MEFDANTWANHVPVIRSNANVIIGILVTLAVLGLVGGLVAFLTGMFKK